MQFPLFLHVVAAIEASWSEMNIAMNLIICTACDIEDMIYMSVLFKSP